jgi:hypothetical protein
MCIILLQGPPQSGLVRLGDSGEPWISPVESGDGRAADSKQGSSTLELFGVLAGDGVRLVKWLSEVGWFHSVAP